MKEMVLLKVHVRNSIEYAWKMELVKVKINVSMNGIFMIVAL